MTTHQFPIIFDEFGCFRNHHDDILRSQLRNTPGVPNATYLVKDGLVFVFDKLVELVKQHQESQDNTPLAALAIRLIPAATVPAAEAIEKWRVLPEPYEIVDCAAGGVQIYHRHFNAVLPGVFQSQTTLQEALAVLLMGGTLPGEGDFIYHNQPMILRDAIDADRLPSRPVLHPEFSAIFVYATLLNVTYTEGFTPVSETSFNDVKARELSWQDDKSKMIVQTQRHIDKLWSRVEALRLEKLCDPTNDVPEHLIEDAAALRSLYPELSMLSDGDLCAWFGTYQSECCYITGWTASRDDGFLIYLMGKVADITYEQDTAIYAGRCAAYALLRGNSMDEAIAFVQDSLAYDAAISKLALAIANAMRFLSDDKNATSARLQGRPISTWSDLHRLTRAA